jgi:hypothetical protein
LAKAENRRQIIKPIRFTKSEIKLLERAAEKNQNFPMGHQTCCYVQSENNRFRTLSNLGSMLGPA